MNHPIYRLEIQILNFGISESFILTYSFTVLVLKRQHFAEEPLFVPTNKTWNGARAKRMLIRCHFMIVSIAMFWARIMKKISRASKSSQSPKEMGASSIASIGKMKTHLRRLRPKHGRATKHVTIKKKGDVLGNDLNNASVHIVSFSSQNWLYLIHTLWTVNDDPWKDTLKRPQGGFTGV